MTPAAPWEITTWPTPSWRRRSAAWRCATRSSIGAEQRSASSSTFGLIIHGAAFTPSRRAAPLLSKATFRPRRRKRRSSSPSHSGSTPRGRLPATTASSCSPASRSRRSSNAAWARSSASGPGPLRSLTRPPRSASLMLLRVSPGTRTNASAKPRRWNMAVNGGWLSSPRKPLTVNRWPRSASTWATFRPLPAAWVSTASLRLTAPSSSWRRRTVRSSAGFRVIVRIRAITAPPLPPGPGPRRRSPGPGLCGPGRAQRPAAVRARRP
ncbi:Uncharacterised protein [Acinetobacter baumannii]|nr:Uncharacterised protein [Acinetobacter baumannii]